MNDEFRITATGHPTEPDRVITRNDLEVSKFIAHSAVRVKGWAKAEVVNTYGGHISNPLWIVTPTEEYDPGES